MPLCFGASGSVRARHTPHCALCAADVHTFCPVSFQPPSARTAFVRSDARSEPAPGSLNSWHQIQLAAERRRHEPLDLLGAAVLEDRRRRPPADHQIGTLDAGGGQLPIDQQLLGRRGVAAVRPRPVRRLQPGLGERDLALLDGQGGDIGDRRGDLGLQMLDRRQVDVQFAADALLRQRRDTAQPARRAAEELRNPVCPAQIQVRVVLPGDADAAEHLDAVLGVGLGQLDACGRRDGGGDRQLRIVGSVGGAGGVACGHCDLLGAQQHLGAHVLDRLEAADRLAELLANLRVFGGGLQRPARQPGGLGGQHGRGEILDASPRQRAGPRRVRR